MSDLPSCPICGSTYTYLLQDIYNCPDCAHEWQENPDEEQEKNEPTVKDAFGNILCDGDSVTIVKDLKVKGATQALKVGTKIKNIRLVEGDHNIDCKIPSFGGMKLKSEFVKKATA